MIHMFVTTLMVLSVYNINICHALSYNYYSYDQLTSILTNYATTYPNKAYLYSIGKTVKGKDMWVLALSDSNPDKTVLLRPEAKYVGNIHGNEPTSKAILLQFIDYLLTNSTDPEVSYLMKNTRIHVLPSMNPDGFEVSSMGDCMSVNGRYNGNNYDLNRNFQDLFECNMAPMQPESLAIIKWLESNRFILSASFHSGSMVVNYPFDNYAGGSNGWPQYSISDDNSLFISLSKNYSYNHATMRSDPCQDGFTDGITNGAAWYTILGGMQDYNYWRHGCMELTIELGCCKYPSTSQLQSIWLENKFALIRFMKQANIGIKGVINFNNGTPAKYVTVQIDNIEPVFKTNELGEYYRILLPGTYTLKILFDCNQVYSTNIQISSSSLLTVFNITLSDTIYQQYNSIQSSLNRYAKFCTSSRQPVPCSNYASTSASTIFNVATTTAKAFTVSKVTFSTSLFIINSANLLVSLENAIIFNIGLFLFQLFF